MRILSLLLLILLLAGCSREPSSSLKQIKKEGTLIVVTRNSPTTYYIGPDGETGLEYDLAKGFADFLGVKLKIVVADSFNDIIPMVVRGEAHLAAAGLTITEERKRMVHFGYPYQEITPQVVYRTGTNTHGPKTIKDMIGKQMEVVAGSSHVERLQQQKKKYPALTWKENSELESEDLLNLVWEQVIDYTVADSNEFRLNQRFNRELRVAFNLNGPESLAWAFPYDEDDSLYKASLTFFHKLKETGELDQLLDRYYGHIDKLGFVDTRNYLRHVKTKLPEFKKLFIHAGKFYDMDWRLLAAIGYQESHWNARARSPTGVRGIMMLTLATAKQLKIKNRLDPEQSIYGGAYYFRRIKDKIPERITEPDRTWMALAAYNIGYGHLEDARKITQMRGGDPDKWIDVKSNLPLLSQKKWYKKTRYGYARGREPVRYVQFIRNYYDLLVWTDEKEKSFLNTPKGDSPEIDSPVL